MYAANVDTCTPHSSSQRWYLHLAVIALLLEAPPGELAALELANTSVQSLIAQTEP